MTTKEPESTMPTPGLEGEASLVLGRVGTALRDLIETTPGMPSRIRGADVQQVLRIPSKLAWQVHRVAFADDPCTVVAEIPGPAALDRVLRAAAGRGASREKVDAVAAALGSFERLVSEHADNRAEFDSIVSGLSQQPSPQVDLMHKRAAFRAQSHFFGVQTDALLQLDIFRPSVDDCSRLDMVSVDRRIGFRRSRPTGGFIVGMRFTDEAGKTQVLPRTEFIAPSEEAAGFGLIPQFSSRPLPVPREVRTGSGAIVLKIEPEGIGAKPALTCATGRVFRKASVRYRDEQNRHHAVALTVRTPTKLLIYDMLVQRGLFPGVNPELVLYSHHNQSDPAKLDPERDRLQLCESVLHLGSGLGVMATADVPNHPALAQYVFERLGWDPSEFDVYRCRIEYPVMPSTVMIQMELPEQPG